MLNALRRNPSFPSCSPRGLVAEGLMDQPWRNHQAKAPLDRACGHQAPQAEASPGALPPTSTANGTSGLNYVCALLDNAANSIQVQLLENKLMMLVGQMTSVFSPRCAPEPPPTKALVLNLCRTSMLHPRYNEFLTF